MTQTETTQTPVVESPWLTTEQAAAYLRCSIPTLRDARRRGKINCGKVGRAYRFSREALDRFVELAGRRSRSN